MSRFHQWWGSCSQVRIRNRGRGRRGSCSLVVDPTRQSNRRVAEFAEVHRASHHLTRTPSNLECDNAIELVAMAQEKLGGTPRPLRLSGSMCLSVRIAVFGTRGRCRRTCRGYRSRVRETLTTSRPRTGEVRDQPCHFVGLLHRQEVRRPFELDGPGIGHFAFHPRRGARQQSI